MDTSPATRKGDATNIERLATHVIQDGRAACDRTLRAMYAGHNGPVTCAVCLRQRRDMILIQWKQSAYHDRPWNAKRGALSLIVRQQPYTTRWKWTVTDGERYLKEGFEDTVLAAKRMAEAFAEEDYGR